MSEISDQFPALVDLVKKQWNMQSMFTAICDEYPAAVCAGRGESWLQMLRAYVELCGSTIPERTKRESL